ncbi:MAG: LTA synthase family protein [Saprospiraceae bacterium]|nr:LTA synthase family protein [Saprospiraceae bacterium]
MIRGIVKSIGNTYFSYFFAAILTVLMLRTAETLHVYLRFDPKQLFASELLGLVTDIFQCGLVLCLVFPLHKQLLARFPGFGKKYGWYLIGFFTFMHITISEYFFYQLRPLDVFVFKHKTEELVFSVSTAESHVLLPALIKYSSIMLLYFILAITLHKLVLSEKTQKFLMYVFLVCSFISIILSNSFKLPVSGNLVVNKSTFLYVNIAKEIYLKLTDKDLRKHAKRFQQEFPGPQYTDLHYPFLHLADSSEKLSEYLIPGEKPPHLVLIIVEGLADDFIHDLHGMKLMPFMDSLSQKSLYWDRCLATSERSFGATPSLNGALPFGNNGFALMDKYPYHFSLVNVLNENAYKTRFFYGQGAWFHGKENFYRFNNIGDIIDKEDYEADFEKVFVGKEKYFWGYNDIDLFKKYFRETEETEDSSRYDVFFTGTSHAPFATKDEGLYRSRYKQHLKELRDPELKKHFTQCAKYYTALLNVDDALKMYLTDFAKRKDYCNTVFIITGDHAITEIPIPNSIKKYHVPLLLYSPLLQHPRTFHEVCSHLDLYETLVPWLQKQYGLRVPRFSSALSTGFKFDTGFQIEKVIPLMTDNRRIDDFFYNGMYLSEGNRMFKVGRNFELEEYYNNKTFHFLQRKLECYRAASVVATEDEMLLPTKIYDDYFGYKEVALYEVKEQLPLPEDGLTIFKDLPCSYSQYYIDLTLSSWNIFNFHPACIVSIKQKSTGKILHTQEFSKTGSSTLQFHIPVILLPEWRNNVMLDVQIRDKEMGVSLLKEVRGRVLGR